MTASDSSITVRIPNGVLGALLLGTGVVGLVVGFFVKPLLNWLLDTVGGAPGPLRVAATLPTSVAVPVLTAVGLLAGALLSSAAWRDSLQLTVDRTGIELAQKGAERYLPREAIDVVFRDGKELVFLDAQTRQLARNDASDLSDKRVRAEFEHFGYPPIHSGDPHEQEYQRWVDGQPGLDVHDNQLLRARARALTDKQQGAAADLAEELQAEGIVVRDRDGAQQYRHIPSR